MMTEALYARDVGAGRRSHVRLRRRLGGRHPGDTIRGEPPQTTSDDGTSSQSQAAANAAATPASQAASAVQNAVAAAPSTTSQTTAMPAATTAPTAPPNTMSSSWLQTAVITNTVANFPYRRFGRGHDGRDIGQPEHAAADLPGLLRGRSRKLRLRPRPAVDYPCSGNGTRTRAWVDDPRLSVAWRRPRGRHRRRERRTVHGEQCVGPAWAKPAVSGSSRCPRVGKARRPRWWKRCSWSVPHARSHRRPMECSTVFRWRATPALELVLDAAAPATS